eukprot:SAG25_NODE_2607_length_1495_cov_1.368911_1_plen_74_part_10
MRAEVDRLGEDGVLRCWAGAFLLAVLEGHAEHAGGVGWELPAGDEPLEPAEIASLACVNARTMPSHLNGSRIPG